MPRRPRNPTATIRDRRAKGRGWQAVVRYPDPDLPKKWRQRAKTFERKSDAQEWADQILAEHRAKPEYRPPKMISVAEWMEHWTRTHVQVHLRPSTARSYEQLIRWHILPSLGEVPLPNLTSRQLQVWVADLVAKGLSPRTATYTRGILHTALEEAVRLDLLAVNPLDKVRPPKAQPKVVQSYTLEEVYRLDAETASHRLGGLFSFLWQTGLRIGEALALRWEDVDLERASLRVRRNVVEVHGRMIEGQPKTAAGTREIALASQTVELLRKQQERLAIEHMLYEERWTEHGLVWPSTVGDHMSTTNVATIWRRLRDQAGLPKYGLHALRHTNASLQLQAGVGIREIAATLGHESPGFTAKVYAHVLEQTKRQAAEKFGRLLDG